jgi:hypothetical protein
MRASAAPGGPPPPEPHPCAVASHRGTVAVAVRSHPRPPVTAPCCRDAPRRVLCAWRLHDCGRCRPPDCAANWCPLKRLSSTSMYPRAARALMAVRRSWWRSQPGVYFFQSRIGLPVRQPRVAVGGQIGAARRTRPARGGEQRSDRRLAAPLEVVVQIA